MLSCKQATSLASDYLEDELPFLQRLGMRIHLARCSHCAEFLSGLREANELVYEQAGAAARPDPDFLNRLRSSVSAHLQKDKSMTDPLEPGAEASNEPLIAGVDDPVDERVRRIFDDIREKEGFVPNLFRAYAHQPDVLEYNWAREKSLLYGGILDESFKSAIVVVVSSDNHCDYCVHHHRAALLSSGFSCAEIEMLVSDPENTRFSDREKALLALVRQANLDPHRPADLLLARVRAEGASDAEIIEAMSVMELYSSWNKFLDVMRIPLESDVC